MPNLNAEFSRELEVLLGEASQLDFEGKGADGLRHSFVSDVRNLSRRLQAEWTAHGAPEQEKDIRKVRLLTRLVKDLREKSQVEAGEAVQQYAEGTGTENGIATYSSMEALKKSLSALIRVGLSLTLTAAPIIAREFQDCPDLSDLSDCFPRTRGTVLPMSALIAATYGTACVVLRQQSLVGSYSHNRLTAEEKLSRDASELSASFDA
ncbi:hypothetical protein Psal006b_01710 [Piscirickettsia salmonis]|uniref:FAD dependent oxidoreductase n=1 Tax=Piscirickettsia salmonis TaxID=1238 RepID=A0A1L6TBR9_PISSA|nr:hypothetical protein [Piscirickettsia salmonis]AKP73869.1 hypothetical protein PSLF89_2107 [Piscirickettsia salmonis LF-89 = ATCC VR-1361]ALB22679.1 FAD dependent oxidoreductase [Piscirickettsia salmonis]ALY02689.1 hypothetical protein AWE47_07340 [Piscirickettsia salmonis]AMA42233.1 hypothetical protein AWJ11_07520 [Piscirickettsia salmonis]AOS34708.1 hypothetical protein AVM72_04680 [Piscirickettsia salmonis]